MVMKRSQTKTRAIPAGEFKAKCLQLIDEAYEHHRDVVITKRGVPMARLIPFSNPSKAAFRPLLGRSAPIKVVGDLISRLPEEDTIPIDPFLG